MIATAPFEVGDRVTSVVSIVGAREIHGTVRHCDWSNENGHTWHLAVRFDGESTTRTYDVATPNWNWPIRKLDPIEALGNLSPPVQLSAEGVLPQQEVTQ